MSAPGRGKLLRIKVRVDSQFNDLVDVKTTVQLDGGPPRAVRARQVGAGDTGHIFVTRLSADAPDVGQDLIYRVAGVNPSTNAVLLDSTPSNSAKAH